MLGEAKFKARPTTSRTASLPVVREGRLPTIPLHPPGNPGAGVVQANTKRRGE
jgi:hypothetical protein